MKRLFLLSIVLIVMLTLPLTSESASTLITKIAGENQIGLAGDQLSVPLTVKVTSEGVVIVNQAVDFVVSSGRGSLTHTSVMTNSEGIAKTELTLGSKAAENIVDVKIGPFYFTSFTAMGVQPVTEKLVTSASFTPNIWKKYIGEPYTSTKTVPDLIDYSYAGYKYGEEAIPDDLGVRTYDVTTYGAIPDDGRSDVDAIKRALRAAQYGGIVFFPPGQYDVLTEIDADASIRIGTTDDKVANIVIRGSGAKGARRGGTTIKMHGNTNAQWDTYLKTAWQRSGKVDNIDGTYKRGVKSFNVYDASALRNKKYIIIQAVGLTGSDFNDHSARPESDMKSQWTDIRNNGIRIREYHEIDRIDGNTVYIKTPTTTPLNNKYYVRWANLMESVGIEDIHFDGGLGADYRHLGDPAEGQAGRNWIGLSSVAHSWVRRCRFSNSIMGVAISSSIATSVIGVVQDGLHGHYTVNISNGATNNFVGLVEVYTSNGRPSHGLNVSNHTTSNVFFGIGGVIDAPDAHGSQPRYTLFDNYFSVDHNSSSGNIRNLPHHLNGYTRWNNTTQSSELFNMWPGNYGAFVEGIMIGYKRDPNGWFSLWHSYKESHRSHVTPHSLWIAQYERRLGHEPTWLEDAKTDYEDFIRESFGLYDNRAPEFDPDFVTSIQVSEDAAINTLISFNLPATDPEGHAITYTLEGTDAASFKLSPKLGRIRTVAALDYETKSSYSVEIRAADAYGGESTLAISITVTDVNENYYLYGRTQQVIDALVDKINGADRAEDVRQASVENIISLDVSNRNVTALKSGDFDDMTSLRTLKLNDNSLKKLPVNIFSDLTSLQYLYIGNNKIATLNASVFSGLDQLAFLYMHNNNIKKLPSGIFRDLSSIYMINLHTNRLVDIGTGRFLGLSTLKQLYLQGNKIKSLSSTSFVGLENLTSLNLSGNILRKLDATAFESLPSSLENLILSDNKISSLPDSIFESFTSLKFLYLQDNRVDPMPIKVSLEKVGRREIKATIPTAAPFDMDIPVSVENGTITDGHTTISIKAGKLETAPADRLSVSRNVNVDDPVTASIGTLPSLPDNHNGYEFTKPDNPLTVLTGLGRSPARQDKPDATALLANYPNPFNPETWIPYQLAKRSDVRITIYNVYGAKVRELPLGIQSAGYYLNSGRAAYWDGRNATGEPVSTGVYFYQLKADNSSYLRKMVIMK